mgnify:CR=1 FL=1
MMKKILKKLFPVKFKSYWEKHKNSDNYDETLKFITENLNFENGDYNIPINWEETYKKELEFPSNQIALGYKIK